MVNGSDVAIEAADLVLLGSFASVVEGIRLGRLVFANLQKVISYLPPAGSWFEVSASRFSYPRVCSFSRCPDLARHSQRLHRAPSAALELPVRLPRHPAHGYQLTDSTSMIIICCFADCVPCITLIMEQEEFDLLSLPPRDAKRTHLINLNICGSIFS